MLNKLCIHHKKTVIKVHQTEEITMACSQGSKRHNTTRRCTIARVYDCDLGLTNSDALA